MTRFVLFLFALIASSRAVEVQDLSDSDSQQDADDLKERQLIRRITRTRIVIPGGYGGYGGGYGYDEDQDQSDTQDEMHNQGFARRFPVLIVPHHVAQRILRRQGIDLDQATRPAEMFQNFQGDRSGNDNAGTKEVVLRLPNRLIVKLLRRYGQLSNL